jgi:cell division initiation protein
MKLTPLEIKQHQFDKSLRGYDVGEVQSFLALVASEMEQLQQKNSELQEQVQGLNKRITHYEKVEEAIHETLQTTKESVAQKMEQARNEANTAMDRAHMEADRMIQEAQQQRSTIRQDMIRLLERRDEMIQSFQQFLENNMGMVEKFAANEFHIFDPIDGPTDESDASPSVSTKSSLDQSNDPSISNTSGETGDITMNPEAEDMLTGAQDIESEPNTPEKKKQASSSSLDDDDFMNTFLDELD